jgi:T5SS/PEP-CTERM-associated repeat protein
MRRIRSRFGVTVPAVDRFVSLASWMIVCSVFCALCGPSTACAQTIWTDGTVDGFVGIKGLNDVLGYWNAATPPGGFLRVPETTGFVTMAVALAFLGVTGVSRTQRQMIMTTKRSSVVMAALVMSVSAAASEAVTRDWNAGSGNWTQPGSWTPAGVPGGGDVVSIGFADGVARTVNYDYSGPSVVLGSLGLDLTGAGSNATTLSMTSAILLNMTNEYVGYFGRGVVDHSAGSATVSSELNLGYNAGSKGTYNLSGAGVLTVGGDAYFGRSGIGILNITAGGQASNLSGDLGFSVGSSGTVNVDGPGSSWINNGVAAVGILGTGSLSVMNGGYVSSVNGRIARDPGSTGTVFLDGPDSRWQMSGDLTVGGISGSGTGTLTIQNQATAFVGNNFAINNVSTANLSGGTLRFNTATGLNRLTYTAGTIQLAGDRDLLIDTVIPSLYGASPVVPSGKALKVEGQTTLRQNKSLNVSGGEFTSQGPLTVGVLNSAGGSLLVNNGGNAVVNANTTIDHFGYIVVNGAGSAFTVAGNLNMGLVSRGDLIIQNQSSVYINNSLTIGSSGYFVLDGGTIRFNGYSRAVPTFNFQYFAGTVQLAGNRSIGSDAAITDFFGASPNIPLGKGLIVEGTAILNATSPVTLSGGTLGADTLLLSPGSQLTTTQPSQVLGAVLSLAGSVINTSDIDLVLGDATKVNGFYGNGTLTVGQAIVSLADANDAVFDSAALVTLGNGAGPGTLNADNGLTLDFGGNVTGFGSINTPNDAATPLINNGHITGNSPGEPVTLSGYVKGVGTLDNAVITGTDTPGFSPATVYRGSVGYAGTLEIEIGGSGAGAFDRLIHSGTATLGGTLDLTLINGFSPSLGDTFELLTANSITGTFNNILGADLGGGLMFDVVYAPTNVSLHVVSSLLDGDLNGDGFVGIADLNIVLGNWNQNVAAGVLLQGDPSGDGFVGIADLNVVLGNWNAGTPPGVGTASTVPEPGAIGFVVLLAALPGRRVPGRC